MEYCIDEQYNNMGTILLNCRYIYYQLLRFIILLLFVKKNNILKIFIIFFSNITEQNRTQSRRSKTEYIST